jgi:hypothetical protein
MDGRDKEKDERQKEYSFIYIKIRKLEREK